MTQVSYTERRGQIETYFDRTAVQAWARLTSDAPVGRVRASVRAGRDRMRATLLSWLPENLSGLRVLDAGCGTGALAVEAAHRGAEVLAIDLSPTLVDLARERQPMLRNGGSIDFRSGDMLAAELGAFDYVVGMDSVIHYETGDAVNVLAGLAQRTRRGLLAPAAIEYAAQAMALHGALIGQATGAPVTPGYLASARGVQLHVLRLDDLPTTFATDAPDELRIEATRQAGDARQILYVFTVHHGDRLLAEGRAAVVLNTPLTA